MGAGKLKRKPSESEFVDFSGKWRTHKANIGEKEKIRIRREKFKRMKQTIRKDVLGKKTVLVEETDPQLATNRTVKAFAFGKQIGWAQRGHRQAVVFERKGTYGRMLARLEEMERKDFAKGKFEEHKGEILMQLQTERKMTPEILSYIDSLKEPVFIDYSRNSNVAAALVKNGYSISSCSVKMAAELGYKLPTTPKELLEFFKKQHTQVPVLFLFTKKVK